MPEKMESHYGSEGIVERIVSALNEAGFDMKNLQPDAFAGADEFHIGGRKGSEQLVQFLSVGAGDKILDVGCGIGGPARFLAGATGAHVTGIDLTPEFVDAAIELSDLVGMSAQVDFQVGSATQIPFEEDSYDSTTMIHVGMNIEDKVTMMKEMARVTRPKSTVLVYDVMRVGEGDLV